LALLQGKSPQIMPDRPPSGWKIDLFNLYGRPQLDFSHKIELVRRQYSGNAHGLIKGIGMVNCVYVNPLTQEHWIIDYRLYDPDGDGKTKLDHVRDMLTNLVHQKRLPFRRVLMDTWHATRDLMLFIESLEKVYYCPLRDNRQVDDSGAQSPYRRVDSCSTRSRFSGGGVRWTSINSRVPSFVTRVGVSVNLTRCVCSALSLALPPTSAATPNTENLIFPLGPASRVATTANSTSMGPS
jgi:hypothetical protein